MCKNDMKKLILLLALMAFTESYAEVITVPTEKTTVTIDRLRVSRRPDAEARLFVADAIEQKIREVQELLKDAPYLAWMFTNCFPNTLDTTVFMGAVDGKPDEPKKAGGFFDIVFGSGAVGTILWFGLFGDAAAAIYFAVDCWVLVKPQKLLSQGNIVIHILHIVMHGLDKVCIDLSRNFVCFKCCLK